MSFILHVIVVVCLAQMQSTQSMLPPLVRRETQQPSLTSDASGIVQAEFQHGGSIAIKAQVSVGAPKPEILLDSLQSNGIQSVVNPISSELLEWCDQASSTVDISDKKAWPSLPTHGHWELGLHRPRVYVISLQPSRQRRSNFAREFARLGLTVEAAQWLPAINGSMVPGLLRNPNGHLARGAEYGFNENLGVFGCYLSHLSAYRHSVKICAECDVVVFEDDVSFHPDFQRLSTEFMQGVPKKLLNGLVNGIREELPVAHFHFGGDAFWEPVLSKGDSYYQPVSVSRTWGYAIKAWHVSALLNKLQVVNPPDDFGIDQVLRSYRFPMVAPLVPLVHSFQNQSYTIDLTGPGQQQDVDDSTRSDFWEHDCWSATFLPGDPCINKGLNIFASLPV